jgi:hypothetical protein
LFDQIASIVTVARSSELMPRRASSAAISPAVTSITSSVVGILTYSQRILADPKVWAGISLTVIAIPGSTVTPSYHNGFSLYKYPGERERQAILILQGDAVQ